MTVGLRAALRVGYLVASMAAPWDLSATSLAGLRAVLKVVYWADWRVVHSVDTMALTMADWTVAMTVALKAAKKVDRSDVMKVG